MAQLRLSVGIIDGEANGAAGEDWLPSRDRLGRAESAAAAGDAAYDQAVHHPQRARACSSGRLIGSTVTHGRHAVALAPRPSIAVGLHVDTTEVNSS